MIEEDWRDVLEEAGARVEVGPVPLTAMLADAARRRRRRAAGGAVAACLVVGAVVVGGVVAEGWTSHGPDVSNRVPNPSTSSPSTSSPSGPATSAPPRPAPVTMRAVRRIGSAQEFRPYTGPVPPPFSKADALHRDGSPDAHSLGLWDVGMVSEMGSVDWHSVWVIASEDFVVDLNQLSLGGRGGSSPPATTPPPRPGWARSVNMYDATSGKLFLGYGF